jgi:glycosyltransferase involved in cell wall biosynthesis
MGGMSLSLIPRAGRAGIPSVAFVHDDWLVYGPRVDAWTRMFGRRGRLAPLVAHATGIPTEFEPAAVTIWQFISETTRRRGHAAGWTLLDSEVSPSGIEDMFLKPAPPLPWRWSLLYVGRIDERKGIDTAISALAHLPTQARLTIVGGGDEQEAKRLQHQVAELSLQDRVVLEGACTRERLPTAYARADVVLFPVRWSEPWGLVPLEAMGIGRPVVATGRGGSGEYLEDGDNCLLFDADDPAGLAAAVRRLHGDPGLRSRLREAGFRTAARFTAARYNDGVERVLLRALRGREVLSSAR